MKTTPFFSICIPAFEQTYFLKQTLDSIKIQEFSDYEIILSDDSYSDRVEELVKTYDFNGKLSYYRQKPALGSPENWNFTMQQARGTWIKILHHDDSLFDKNTLSDLFQVAQKTDKHWIVGAPVQPPPPINRFCTIFYPRGLNLLKSYPGILGFGNCIDVPSVLLVKRTCEISYNKNLIWLVDIDYYLRLIEKFGFFEYLPKPIIWRNVGGHNLSHQYQHEPNAELNELFSLYKSFPDKFPWFLSLIISAKLIRICSIWGITHRNQLEKLDWEYAPFWVKAYFDISLRPGLQRLLVFICKVMLIFVNKNLSAFLMKRIQIMTKIP
jgi:glycosyltransferase involved in cell wall biosynthesis